MGNRLGNSLSIIRGTSFIPLEAAEDHFGCTQVLSSVDEIVSDPWAGACGTVCFILRHKFVLFSLRQKILAFPIFLFPGTLAFSSDQYGVSWVFLWAFAELPSPGFYLPLGSSDFRWALS